MKKRFKRLLIVLAAVLVLTAAGTAAYLSDYYPASEAAIAVMDGTDAVVVAARENLTVLAPKQPNGTGLIFYPGGKVEHTAYLPLLERLAAQGITCFLMEMPFRLAVFDPDAADGMFGQFPNIETWYIGGHSLGGAMASGFAADHPDKIAGVVLLGSYLYGGWPAEKSITIYGSEDLVLDRSKITYTENVVVLKGGNHAQFGSYGPQEGDGTATISPQEQQTLAAQLILEYITTK